MARGARGRTLARSYYHLVFTLPAAIAGIAYQNKADYRTDGNDRYKTMTLDVHGFIRRFIIRVLPNGFHRIHRYGLFASGVRARNIGFARELLAAPASQKEHARANDDNKAGLHAHAVAAA